MQITNVQSFAVRALGTVLALAVLAGAFACGYFLGLRNVHDNGGGTAAVGSQLDAAATNQRQLDASIGRAAEQSRGLADSLDRSAGAVDRSKAAADGLQLQIQTLQDRSTKQEQLLNEANESFVKFGEEQKRTRLRVKAQRNAWEAVAACALIAFVAK